MAKSRLANILLQHGAPVLKSMLENVVGGIPGRIGGAVLGELAESFGTKPEPDAIAAAIEKNPEAATPILTSLEIDAARVAEAARDATVSYHGVLLEDARAEGWLQSRWRPIFALVFSLCFLMVTVVMSRAVWTNAVDVITAFAALTGFLIAFFGTGAAVLGVYVWRRSDDKAAGV